MRRCAVGSGKSVHIAAPVVTASSLLLRRRQMPTGTSWAKRRAVTPPPIAERGSGASSSRGNGSPSTSSSLCTSSGCGTAPAVFAQSPVYVSRRCYSSDEAGGGGGGSGGGDGGGGGGYGDSGGSGIGYFTGDDTDLIPRNVQALLKTDLLDYPNRKCLLCNEAIIGNIGAHQSFPPHQARLGLVQRALTGMAGPPDLIAERWWLLLHEPKGDGTMGFGRIGSLSHRNQRQRRRRVCYLLDFLQRRGIIREALGIFRGGVSLGGGHNNGATSVSGQAFAVPLSGSLSAGGGPAYSPASSDVTSFHRSFAFERFEMIGDNVVKFIIPDRLFRMFPQENGSGGPTSQISMCQQMLDCNDGLLRIYDYLDLDRIIGVKLPNSKSKADVVESLFGELQCFLWATEQRPSGEVGLDPNELVHVAPDGFLLPPELRYVRAVVEHLLNEIAHCVLMWACEETLLNAREFISTHYEACSAHATQMLAGRKGGGGGAGGGSRHGYSNGSSAKANGPRGGPKGGGVGGADAAHAAYLASRGIPTAFPGHPTNPKAADFYKEQFAPLLKPRLPTAEEKGLRLLAARTAPPSRITAPYFSRVRNRAAPPLHTGTALCWFLGGGGGDGKRMAAEGDEKGEGEGGAAATAGMLAFQQSLREGLLGATAASDGGGVTISGKLSPAPFALPTAANPDTSCSTVALPPLGSRRLAYVRALEGYCATDTQSWPWAKWWAQTGASHHQHADAALLGNVGAEEGGSALHLRLALSPTPALDDGGGARGGAPLDGLEGDACMLAGVVLPVDDAL